MAVAGAVVARHRAASTLVYATSLGVRVTALVLAGSPLLAFEAPAGAMKLPLGLPWLGAHFRLDALAAFFLLVVNLGAATASLFGLGYGRHEESPARVLPFFPAFLAGMNLGALADDAFTFLLSRACMSLSSWPLLMAHRRNPRIASPGY